MHQGLIGTPDVLYPLPEETAIAELKQVMSDTLELAVQEHQANLVF